MNRRVWGSLEQTQLNIHVSPPRTQQIQIIIMATAHHHFVWPRINVSVCVCEHQLLTLLLKSKLLLFQCTLSNDPAYVLKNIPVIIRVIFRLSIITSQILHRCLFWGKTERRIAVMNSGWPPLSKNGAHFMYFFNIFFCFFNPHQRGAKKEGQRSPARRH